MAQPKVKKERLGKIDVSKSIVDELKLVNPDLYGEDDGGWNGQNDVNMENV